MKAHITNLGLQNFRVFKDRTHFEFAQITVLTGTNSSGKSSLINSILVLRDSIIKSGITKPLNIKKLSELKISPNSLGEKFGDFKNLLSWNSDSDIILYDFELIINEKCPPIIIHFLFKVDPHTNSGYGIPFFVLGFTKDSLTEIFRINFFDISSAYEALNDWETIPNTIYLNFNLSGILKFMKNGLGENSDFYFQFEGGSGRIINLGENHDLLNVKNLISYSSTFLSDSTLKDINDKLGSGFINEQFLLFLSAINNSNNNLLNDHTNQYSDLEVNTDLIGFINIEDTFEDAIKYLNEIERGEKNEKDLIIVIKEIIEEITSEIDSFDINLVAEIFYIIIKARTDRDGDFAALISRPINLAFQRFFGFLLKASLEPIRTISEVKFFNYNDTPVKRAYSLYEKNLITNQLERILSLRSGNKEQLLSFIRKWVINFGIAEDIIIYKDPDTAICKLSLRIKTGREILLADFGHGIFKLIPLIFSVSIDRVEDYLFERNTFLEAFHVRGLYGDNPRIVLCIEEPEANLHPALQSKLADMFVDAAKTFNTQFIIETHSEYLIRKLQYLTAKGELKPEDTAIYYFYPPDNVPPGEDQVKRIDIQEDGSLTDDFGTGFFDEADKIAMSIWNMNKSQKN